MNNKPSEIAIESKKQLEKLIKNLFAREIIDSNNKLISEIENHKESINQMLKNTDTEIDTKMNKLLKKSKELIEDSENKSNKLYGLLQESQQKIIANNETIKSDLINVINNFNNNHKKLLENLNQENYDTIEKIKKDFKIIANNFQAQVNSFETIINNDFFKLKENQENLIKSAQIEFIDILENLNNSQSDINNNFSILSETFSLLNEKILSNDSKTNKYFKFNYYFAAIQFTLWLAVFIKLFFF